MKMTIFSKHAIVITFVLTVLTFSPYQLSAQKKSNVLRIGTYDSRIIVMAYSRSELFARHQELFIKQSDSAQKVNDTAKMKELSIQAMSNQHLLHLMVFGSGSASAIVNLIKEQLPDVAEKANVDIIISKFELSWTDPKVEIIDVTNDLVKLFKPKENIDKMCNEIAKTDPVPLEELTLEEDMLDLYCTRYGKK
jgi:hypothetical protein